MSWEKSALEIIARIGGVDPATLEPEMGLVAHLGLDSAKALELLIDLEETLEIEISDEDAAELRTVGDILSCLERLEPAAG